MIVQGSLPSRRGQARPAEGHDDRDRARYQRICLCSHSIRRYRLHCTVWCAHARARSASSLPPCMMHTCPPSAPPRPAGAGCAALRCCAQERAGGVVPCGGAAAAAGGRPAGPPAGCRLPTRHPRALLRRRHAQRVHARVRAEAARWDGWRMCHGASTRSTGCMHVLVRWPSTARQAGRGRLQQRVAACGSPVSAICGPPGQPGGPLWPTRTARSILSMQGGRTVGHHAMMSCGGCSEGWL